MLLGIETSCDETAAAVLAASGDPRRPLVIRSNVVASQVDIHREWGGVVPELASRQHVRDICGVVERALDEAQTTWSALDAVAVTQGPGLVGSLLVGVAFAKAAAWAHRLPLVGVHHLAGHIESLWLAHGSVPVPAVVLVVSGGHTNLYLVPEAGHYRLLGRTRDDAAGEAYDKLAKLVGLGYPGGPLVDRLAATGDPDAVDLPITRLTHRDRNAPDRDGRLDFSFSGVKTAVLRHVRARQAALGTDRLPERDIADLCAAFQRTVVQTLLGQTLEAAVAHRAQAIGVAGGVSANSRLRADLEALGRRRGLPVFVPPLSLATDNAAMIAAAGARLLERGRLAGPTLNAAASLVLA
ncbi:MAG: tRNA (adenosine(37)-N6)-threonylcarbamoyltransferase complex transferase subunit TsaD [Vicinamibacterales bacterium]